MAFFTLSYLLAEQIYHSNQENPASSVCSSVAIPRSTASTMASTSANLKEKQLDPSLHSSHAIPPQYVPSEIENTSKSLDRKHPAPSLYSSHAASQSTSSVVANISEGFASSSFKLQRDVENTKESDKKESLQQLPKDEPQVAVLLSIDILSRLLIEIKKEPRQTPYLAPFVKAPPLVKVEVTKRKVHYSNETQAPPPPPPLSSAFAILKPLLKRTKIKHIRTDQHEYHFYGSTSPEIISSEAAKFICGNSRASKSSIQRILKQFLAITTQDSQDNCHVRPEAIWFLVNMTKKSKDFNTARWHRDGRMIECTDSNHVLHCRYATTLSGPTTLVLPETDRVSKAMRTYAGNRRKISEVLASEEPIKISRNQIIRFSWGREDSPVHSEPDLITDRVFISCIYGSICEIRDIASTRRQVVGDPQAFFRVNGEK
ncbi:bab6c99b-688e-463d-8ba2-339c44dd7522 [Sclerotinia trifoliorum]|uniref:Bab6c99b-688e-463d-8ba2-339c44dd7522 n=1 Tax=Sclerotinia trifoliorum TaxID=28548 RepID=A0A8H2ZMN8_9HELO|nr:bab6c99b-688e-463d-8ba2-339c44dd7522 [Sclerotinia trifoliorum]